MSREPQFDIGVNVFVLRDGKLLLGRRKNGYQEGSWAMPGGHLETKEGIREASMRELMEETGLSCGSMEFVGVVNDPQGHKHYIQFGFIAHDIEGEPQLLEPDRCEGWEWIDPSTIPEDIFAPQKKLIQNFFGARSSFVDSE
jgi:8-oxo-dGTP diphosphatase